MRAAGPLNFRKIFFSVARVLGTHQGVARSRSQGDEVEYDIDESGAKPQAVNVTGPGGRPLMRTARSRYRRVEPNKKHAADAAQGQKSKPASI